jgi:hypothetical protein
MVVVVTRGIVVVVVTGTVVVVVTGTVVVGAIVVAGTVVVGGAVVVGIVESIVIESDGLEVETFPALSVITAVTDQVPSVSVERSHDVATAVSYVHVMVVPPLTADIVTMSPVDTPDTPTAGVVSDVLLSVVEEPVSDAASRSGIEG